jgi:hypothetical protein
MAFMKDALEVPIKDGDQADHAGPRGMGSNTTFQLSVAGSEILRPVIHMAALTSRSTWT